MEHAKTEIVALEQTLETAHSAHLAQLSELQLALVGGGAGDVVFA